MVKIQLIKELFEANRNPDNQLPMENYMRNQFPFLGIKSPERKQLMRTFFSETKILKEPFQEEFVLNLWDLPEREYQYAALDYIERMQKKLKKEDFSLLEQLIVKKSWWDTVDALAAKPVGTLAKKDPELIEDYILHWVKSTNLWLQRTAILFQLKYKEDTDERLLYEIITFHKDSDEFFIQKAIGWALREYSKTNPNSVKRFIESTELPKLSVREGSKYIK